MLKVVFCYDGQAVNDFRAYDFADRIIKTYQRTCIGNQDMIVRFSTECVLDALVLRAMEDDVLAKRIEFYYQAPGMESEIKMEFDNIRGLKIPDGVNEVGVRCEMTRRIFKFGLEHLKAKSEKEARKEN